MEAGQNHLGVHRRAVSSVLVALIASLSLLGCVQVKFRAGKAIELGRLAELSPGRSSAREVRDLLGDPFGEGRSMLPFQAKPLDVWTYYYEIGTMSDSRRTFLFVYLDNGRYDGHMWFSSLPEEHR